MDIEKWQKLADFVSKNLAGVIVGAVIGVSGTYFFYENVRLASIRAEIDRLKSTPQADAQYQTWKVTGAVDLKSGKIPYHNVITSVDPPELRLKSDGSFIANFLVEVDSGGRRKFPQLIFSGIVDHNQPVVHLWEPEAKAPLGAEDYGAQLSSERREIRLNKKVEFRPLPREPLSPTQRAKKTEPEGR